MAPPANDICRGGLGKWGDGRANNTMFHRAEGPIWVVGWARGCSMALRYYDARAAAPLRLTAYMA
jgi:hypothetical protein